MIWNRKEVFIGYTEKFNEVRQILASNKIEYKYRLVNNSSGSTRDRIGSFGENMEYSIIYYVYVHKKDYDNACVVLKRL